MLSCLPFLLLSRLCHCKYVPPQLRSHQSDRLNSGRHFGATRGNRAVNWFCGLDGRTHGWMEAAWNIRETAPYLESRETHVGGGEPDSGPGSVNHPAKLYRPNRSSASTRRAVQLDSPWLLDGHAFLERGKKAEHFGFAGEHGKKDHRQLEPP